VIGRSVQLRTVLERAVRVAHTTVPVLVCGESGTGKELLARHIHEHSPRARGPFVAVNCAAIPKELLEAELFGYERGAFTGALRAREGAFERAHEGTLFLDEIGDMALEHQAKLLRVVQEGEVQRVGAGSGRRVDVRLISATHRDLRARAGAGEFREDLFYRLDGYELRLPPLRERGRDVLAIAGALLAREHWEKTLSPAAERAVLGYAWPGNVRELQNVVRAAAIDTTGDSIPAENIRQHMPAHSAKSRTSPADRESLLLRELEELGQLSASDARRLLGVGKSQGQRFLSQLQAQGMISRAGRGRGTSYQLAGRPRGT
jgi:transcriptional regulator with GAF, ATPase, and Fis domain